MIKAVLVDDELLVLQLLQKIISETAGMQVLAAFTDPEQAFYEIPRLSPDVLFLDVDMPEMNGIELAAKLVESKQTEDMSIVFVTAYEQYAIRAFELNAIHYLLKPVDPPSVDEIINRVSKNKGIQRSFNAANVGEIYVFGPMHLRVNGTQVNFLSPKIEELLALLLTHRDNGIHKWQIIDVLWEASSIEKSQQNLYTMIFRLKQILHNAGIKIELNRKNGMYRIALADVYCDLLEFEQLAAKGSAAHPLPIHELEKAISLYQGEFLAGKDYLWCMPLREKYYQKYVEIVQAVAVYYIEHDEGYKLKKLLQAVKPLLQQEDYDDVRKM